MKTMLYCHLLEIKMNFSRNFVDLGHIAYKPLLYKCQLSPSKISVLIQSTNCIRVETDFINSMPK